jgi:hypothetical protein
MTHSKIQIAIESSFLTGVLKIYAKNRLYTHVSRNSCANKYLIVALLTHLAIVLATTTQHYLTAIAVIPDVNRDAQIECWQFETPLKT